MKYYYQLWGDRTKKAFSKRKFVIANTPEEAEEKIRGMRDKVRQKTITNTVIQDIWNEDGIDIKWIKKPSQLHLPSLSLLKPDPVLIAEAKKARVKDVVLPTISLDDLRELFGALLSDPYAEPPFNPEPRRSLLLMMRDILVERGQWSEEAEKHLQKVM